MAKERVTKAMLDRQQDPVLRSRISALLRGEPLDNTVHLRPRRPRAGLPRSRLPKPTEEELVPGTSDVNAYGAVTIRPLSRRSAPGWHHAGRLPLQRPGGGGRRTTLKLAYKRDEEWWRKAKQVQNIRTSPCIFRADLSRLMEPTALAGRPFNLTTDEQEQWAREQGGSGVTTVEKAAYLAIRSVAERNLPPWGSGAFLRCANACGSGSRLAVNWSVGDGFVVVSAYLEGYWNGGALPEKSVALGA